MNHPHMKVVTGVAIATLIVLASACSSKAIEPSNPAPPKAPEATAPVAPSEGESGTTVASTVKEMSVSVAPESVPAGEVVFDVTNDGAATHEFVVFKTDLAPADLPMTEDGRADEEGTGVKHIGEIEDVTPGSTKSFSLQLDPGNYVVVCNLPGHYTAGMTAALTVA